MFELPKIELGQIDLNIDKRIHHPKKIRSFRDSQIAYKNAESLAKELNVNKGERYFTFIAGEFIFGDFIEAFCVEKNYHIKSMTISTLSLSEENIDSLENLIVGEYVDQLNLIVSDYFYAHERHSLVKYIYEHLDKENKFQLSVARSHTKICIFETHCGMKFVIHGSANLRSSDNIEQFDIEENKDLYDYIYEFNSKIAEVYQTINKSIGAKKLWHQVDKDQAVREAKPQQKHEALNERKSNPKF